MEGPGIAGAMREFGKILLGFGVLMVIMGGVLLLAGNLSDKVPWLGRLPGDLEFRRGNWTFYFPLATSLLISLILTILFSLFGRR
jgi:tellurite resistance protein TehA-like permease